MTDADDLTDETFARDAEMLVRMHDTSWNDDSECPRCCQLLYLLSPELERRGLCNDCLDTAVAYLARALTRWHYATPENSTMKYTHLNKDGDRDLYVWTADDQGQPHNTVLTAKSKDLAERTANALNAWGPNIEGPTVVQKPVPFDGHWILACLEVEDLDGVGLRKVEADLVDLRHGVHVVVRRRAIQHPDDAKRNTDTYTVTVNEVEGPLMTAAQATAHLQRLGITSEVLHALDDVATNDDGKPVGRVLELDP